MEAAVGLYNGLIVAVAVGLGVGEGGVQVKTVPAQPAVFKATVAEPWKFTGMFTTQPPTGAVTLTWILVEETISVLKLVQFTGYTNVTVASDTFTPSDITAIAPLPYGTAIASCWW